MARRRAAGWWSGAGWGVDGLPRTWRSRVISPAQVAAAAGMLALLAASLGGAQTPPKTLPDTTIAPAGGDTSPPVGDTEGPDISAPSAPEEAPSPVPASRPAPRHRVHNTVPLKAATYTGPVEPGQAMLQLRVDGWAYALPTTSASHIERLHAGKYVAVTGSTVHYLRIKLKSGATAYVLMSAVELARPTDKVFRLTKDTPVLSAPNHASRKLAEVHNGHDVHVIGTSMSYLKIRMKNGLEGFIAMTALE